MKKGASKSGETPSFEMTWGSSTSSGYCSEEDSDSEFEQYFTARTSFFPKTRKANANANDKKVSVRPKRTVDGRCLNKDIWCSGKFASPSYFKTSNSFIGIFNLKLLAKYDLPVPLLSSVNLQSQRSLQGGFFGCSYGTHSWGDTEININFRSTHTWGF